MKLQHVITIAGISLSINSNAEEQPSIKNEKIKSISIETTSALPSLKDKEMNLSTFLKSLLVVGKLNKDGIETMFICDQVCDDK